MTEMKRVPYRISHREEGDMFEQYSCSSDFERQEQMAKIGHMPTAL